MGSNEQRTFTQLLPALTLISCRPRGPGPPMSARVMSVSHGAQLLLKTMALYADGRAICRPSPAMRTSWAASDEAEGADGPAPRRGGPGSALPSAPLQPRHCRGSLPTSPSPGKSKHFFDCLVSGLQHGHAHQPFHFALKTPVGRSKGREPSPASQTVFHVQRRLVNQGGHILVSLTHSAFLGHSVGH